MANFKAVAAIGDAVAKYLDLSFQQDTTISSAVQQCTFRTISSGELAAESQTPLDKTLTLFLHRITLDEQLRMPARLPDPSKRALLLLDLHYLVTYWGSNADDETLILAWVMQQLQLNPILDAALLPTDIGWGPEESVQIVPANLSLEDVMRIWDAIGPTYHLSVTYTVRPVRIDVAQQGAGPVVATRFEYTGVQS